MGLPTEVGSWDTVPRAHPGSSLDTVILVGKLLVIEAKLVHEGGRHLLDLVLRESLAGVAQGRPQTEAAPREAAVPRGFSQPNLLGEHERRVVSKQPRASLTIIHWVARGPPLVQGAARLAPPLLEPGAWGPERSPGLLSAAAQQGAGQDGPEPERRRGRERAA